MRNVLGYCCELSDGKLELMIRGNEPLASVIATLAHEGGHARQRALNPSQSKQGLGTQIGALREAEAYAFEVAMVRNLGIYTRLNTSRFPNISGVLNFIDAWLAEFEASIGDSNKIHGRGMLLLWLAALSDPGFTDLKDELTKNYSLPPESLFAIHNYFVELQTTEVDKYVETLLASFNENRNIITGTINRRVGFGVPFESFIKHSSIMGVAP